MWINSLCKQNTQTKCPICSVCMIEHQNFHELPNLLVFKLQHKVQVSKTVELMHQDKKKLYKLRGIVYHGAFHFNSCVISETGDIWYHNGMATGDKCVPDGQLKNISDKELMTCKDKNSVLAVYTI